MGKRRTQTIYLVHMDGSAEIIAAYAHEEDARDVVRANNELYEQGVKSRKAIYVPLDVFI